MKLTNLIIDKAIKDALKEDMPYGDVSTDSIFSGNEISKAVLKVKEDGVIAGLDVAKRVFEIVDKDTKFEPEIRDGVFVRNGDVIVKITGKTASLLKAERVALNFLQRMSGIATRSRKISDLVKDFDVKIVDTRKTTPNLRVFEKYSVKIGGASNHRFSLSDAVMLKDNHIKAAGGIEEAIKKSRLNIPHTMKIEVETETVEQVKEAVLSGADIIMLDNMSREEIEKSIKMIDKKAIVEVSGNLTEENIREKIVSGVDVMSLGSLTHSIKSLDISMKII